MDANNYQIREKKERKTRRDAGIIMATRRDQYCIAWIAEQYAARGDQIRRLLSRFPDARRPFKDGELIAETTVRDQIARWQRAGWIEYRRILADEPGFAWVTRKGLQLVDLDEIYTARIPASTRLSHIYAINQVRLGLDERFTWRSERRLRSELDPKKVKDVAIPDGVITTREGRCAVEVEISAKKPAELGAKLVRLVRHWEFNVNGKQSYIYPKIAFFVPNEKMSDLVESACEKLREDEGSRISIDVWDNLIASKFR